MSALKDCGKRSLAADSRSDSFRAEFFRLVSKNDFTEVNEAVFVCSSLWKRKINLSLFSFCDYMLSVSNLHCYFVALRCVKKA